MGKGIDNDINEFRDLFGKGSKRKLVVFKPLRLYICDVKRNDQELEDT